MFKILKQKPKIKILEVKKKRKSRVKKQKIFAITNSTCFGSNKVIRELILYNDKKISYFYDELTREYFCFKPKYFKTLKEAVIYLQSST